MGKRTFYLCVILLFRISLNPAALAQERWFEAAAGTALSMPAAKGSPWKYQPRLLIHGGISGFFSLNKTVAIKTGVLYQMKGMSTIASYAPDSIYMYERFNSRNDYHFISIPLQLALSFPGRGQDQFRVAAGMNYGFMAAGYSRISIESYYQDQSKRKHTRGYYHLVAAEPKDNQPGLPHNEGTPLRVFTPALRADLTYQWQERLLLSVFYEYNLEDVRIRSIRKSKVNLHYAGISAGVRFW